jgi:hypothetical protein
MESGLQLEQRVYYLVRDKLSTVTLILTNETYSSNLDQSYPKYLTGREYNKEIMNADPAINVTPIYLLV